ncbi:MAG: UbiX family flavin prenyltransferase [Syntrophobacterales bacterium]|nr:UbiX family flavin prenyltransferase [Syntrophobacterales bacterium]
MKKRIIVGITGASGIIYARRVIEILLTLPTEIHLIISDMGWKILKHEIKVQYDDLTELIKDLKNDRKVQADVIIHDNTDLFAPVASGSFPAHCMVVIPCSMKTLSAVATGYTNNLIQRAADVTLKEKRPLILVTRETPLSLIHLKNMVTAAEAGATIMPASPGFYNHPQSINDLVDFAAVRILDHLNIEYPHIMKWKGNNAG